MTGSDDLAGGLLNKGFILDRSGARGPGAHGPGAQEPGRGGRTFLVTGAHRSGTSLVASLLRAVGIFMGAAINDIVHEDETFGRLLEARDRAGLVSLIAERNAAYGTWGFKLPMLCAWLDADDMALFNNPHVITVFRDPVAIAVRAALSEYQAEMVALRRAADDMAAMVGFVERLRCASLLLSYEKSLVFPADFVDAVLRFCGLPENAALREQLVSLIEPNRPSYIVGSRRRYEGVVEAVRDGCLHGWCRLTGVADPVTLELQVDGQTVLTFVADGFRQDLLDAGYGTGRHGFCLDLGSVGVRGDSVIRIQVAAHGFALENSGRRVAAYG
jgi:hypothetical protein